jgi:DNA-binding protein YbaB
MTEPFSFGGTPDEINRRLSAFNEQAQRRFREAAAARQAMSNITATAESNSGAIRVTVSSTGALTGLTLTESVKQRSAATISADILACVQRAQANLADRAAEAMAAAMPADSRMADLVVGQLRQSFPVPEPTLGGAPTASYKLARELAESMEDSSPPPAPPPARPRSAPVDDGDFENEPFFMVRREDR